MKSNNFEEAERGNFFLFFILFNKGFLGIDT